MDISLLMEVVAVTTSASPGQDGGSSQRCSRDGDGVGGGCDDLGHSIDGGGGGGGDQRFGRNGGGGGSGGSQHGSDKEF